MPWRTEFHLIDIIGLYRKSRGSYSDFEDSMRVNSSAESLCASTTCSGVIFSLSTSLALGSVLVSLGGGKIHPGIGFHVVLRYSSTKEVHDT